MARKRATGFTDVELEVMRSLWDHQGCTSDELRMYMPGSEKRKDSTMRTILLVMEKKGYVRHETAGRTYLYYPMIEREDAQKSAIMRVLDKVFNGSPQMLLQCVLDSAELDTRTVREIRNLLKTSGNTNLEN